MPAALLGLPDELIQHVGFYLHQDNFIPLPSFHPHWANFASEIDFTAQKDYMSFRTSCKRVKNLLPPNGLHIRVKKWERLLAWTVDAPSSFRAGVRRLEVDIPPRKNLSLKYAWPVFIHFLGLLVGLEELTLFRSPLCLHTSKSLSTEDLQIPLHDFLPKLRSFSNSTNCEQCQRAIFNLLIPTMPSLCFLKTCDPDEMSPALTVWSARYPGTSMKVQTLHLKVPNSQYLVGLCETLPFSDLFPRLRTLSITPLSQDDPWKLESGAQLRADRSKHSLGIWQPEFRCWQYFDGQFAAFTNEYNTHEWVEVKDWLETYIAPLHELQELDLSITFTIEPRRPQNIYTRHEKISHSSISSQEAIEKYEIELRSGMAAAAATLVEVLPNLRIGYFWEPCGYTTTGEDLEADGRSVEQWYRWKWFREPRGNDTWGIRVSSSPQNFASDFTVNQDGTEYRYGILPE